MNGEPKGPVSSFPKTLYVKQQGEDDDAYFVAETELESLADAGESIDVGEYHLVRTGKVALKLSSDLKG